MESKLTKEIAKNYPKVWKILKEKYHNNYINQSDYVLLVSDARVSIVYIYAQINDVDLPFNLLYALLKNFFKDYNIKIVNCYRCDEEKYYPEIYNGNYPEYIEFENVFEDENDCEYFSILEACKIMEERNGK